jgi:signal transduction histidine kinase
MDAPTALGLAALLLAFAALIWALRERRGAETLRRTAAAARERDRLLSLAARDLQAAGAALRGAPDAEAVRAHARHLMRLADDVSDAVALAAGPRHIAEAEVPLAPLLAAAVSAAERELAPGLRVWRVAPAFEGLSLRADARALTGALTQILLRAARSTGEGEVVEIRLATDSERLAIIIEDEGVGQGAGDLEGVGEGPRHRGVGLGLALARDLARAHGGDLLIETAKGIGARYWLSLPRARLVAG